MLTKETISAIESATLENGLRTIAALFPGDVVFSSSLGQEDQVLTDMILKNKIPVSIFTIDTGRLFNETYELIEKTNARYRHSMKVFFPAANEVEAFVLNKGINSFYESTENRKSCCDIRKVQPLNRALKGAKVWITGLRASQSDNRKQMPMIEWDDARSLYKFNPLINWSYEAVLEYLSVHQVPYNTLHDKGYPSIGCAPCTRAVSEGEDARAGRWWWENSQKECGLHQTVIK